MSPRVTTASRGAHRVGCVLGYAMLMGGLLGSGRVLGQLAITEVMSSAAEVAGEVSTSSGSDFWELTNFGTNAIDVTGYTWTDSFPTPLVPLVKAGTPPLVIAPGQSVIFVRERETTNESQFREWWGSCLAAEVPVRFYPSRPGFDDRSDGVRVYDRAGMLVDRVDFGVAREGVTFTYRTDSGEFGVFSTLTNAGVCVADGAGDIGSPGVTSGAIPLRILHGPQSLDLCAGLEARFTVGAVGMPRPRFTWWFNGAQIAGAWQSTLVIPNTSPAHAGEYVVEVSNGLTTLRSEPALLTVRQDPSSPSISSPPDDQYLYVGQTASFAVNVCAYPPPNFEWFLNDQRVPEASGRTLTLPNCTLAQSGARVRVRVANNLGSATASARLIVTTKPRIQITEVMAAAATDWPTHEDWFELTNLDTNAIDLRGFRYSDRFALEAAQSITNSLVLAPGESVVFVERMDPDAFRGWWGLDLLPVGLQVLNFAGMGLSRNGEQLYLWNAAAITAEDVVDSRSYAGMPPGQSRYFEEPDCYDGCLSQAGQSGAFVASVGSEVGSPGYTHNPVPRLLRITAASDGGVRLDWRASPGKTYQVRCKARFEQAWTDLTSQVATSFVATAWDYPLNTQQRFYRVEEN